MAGRKRPPSKSRSARSSSPQPAGSGKMPSREALLAFVQGASGRVGKRELSRHFGLGAAERGALKAELSALAQHGGIAPAGNRRFAAPNRVADEMLVQITGTDLDGEAVGRPVAWVGADKPPAILMAPEPRGQAALAPGARVLARVRPIGPGRYEGRTIRRLAEAAGRILGIFRPTTHDPRSAGRITPTDRRTKAEWLVPVGQSGGAEAGEIVRAEPLPHTGHGLKPVRIVERLGQVGDARSVSLICILTHDIPTEFSVDAIAQAEQAEALALAGREDLRGLALITIDGEDARDFDDAVYAEPAGDGFRLIVAIADVAAYVRAGTALDRDAWTRGNSVYFPDRVVPMLPEALSNGWCSLRPNEDRGCLFVDMTIDAAGHKLGHRFGRGLMRSAARLTYEQVQQAQDGGAQDSEAGGPMPAGLRASLYAAFQLLLAARQARGTLDLDLPERRVLIDAAGKITAIVPRPRLDSHRLIEEFMVLANVAAAEELERLRQPCMYRVHAPPSPEKLSALRDFLATLSISLAPGNDIHPRLLDQILRQVAGTEHARLVNETMLRSQSQAEYTTDNAGHFGLALARYAHFTSPIRRYADLLVHRALIAGLRLGADGLAPGSEAQMAETATHITATERRAAMAERDAIDRYLAAFLADQVGAVFAARISGVARFGLFVTLAESGASGIVPVSSLADDFWVHDETNQTLRARRTGLTYRLGQAVDVRLTEATPVTGGLVFQICAEPPRRRPGRR